MRRFVLIDLLPAGPVTSECGDHPSKEVLAQMRAIWPQFFQLGRGGFHLKAELGDPTIDGVIEFLHKTGREPNWRRMPPAPYEHPTLFQVIGERTWDASDLENAEYFRLDVTRKIADGRHLLDGELEIHYGTYRRDKKVSFGQISVDRTPVCSDEFRKKIEAQKFLGIDFQSVSIKSREPVSLKLWRVWSRIALPPVLNPLVGVQGEPYDPATSECCVIDDLFWPPSIQYLEPELRTIEPFDIALSSERFGPGPPHVREPAIIVSRRFRQWCLKEKLPTVFWPVELR